MNSDFNSKFSLNIADQGNFFFPLAPKGYDGIADYNHQLNPQYERRVWDNSFTLDGYVLVHLKDYMRAGTKSLSYLTFGVKAAFSDSNYYNQGWFKLPDDDNPANIDPTLLTNYHVDHSPVSFGPMVGVYVRKEKDPFQQWNPYLALQCFESRATDLEASFGNEGVVISDKTERKPEVGCTVELVSRSIFDDVGTFIMGPAVTIDTSINGGRPSWGFLLGIGLDLSGLGRKYGLWK